MTLLCGLHIFLWPFLSPCLSFLSLLSLRQVILWGRTEKCLKETAEDLSQSGTECHYFICDVANREEVYRQAKVVREKVCVSRRLAGHRGRGH